MNDGDGAAWNAMVAIVNDTAISHEVRCQKLLGNNPDGTRNLAFPIYIHWPSFRDYMIAHIAAGAEDWPDHNYWVGRRRGAALIGRVLVPLIALVFYGVLGAPDRADAPYAEQQALLKTSTDIDSLMLRVEQQLAAHPDDVKGWQVIAPIYLEVARYNDAVKAYLQLLRLKGPNAADFSGQGEALVLAAEGVVTSEARQVFEQALALDGTQLRARYYSAIALEQDGDQKVQDTGITC